MDNPANSECSDLHSTRWNEVDVPRFIALTTFFSTVENAIFYPFYVLKTREQSDRDLGRALASPWQSFRWHTRALFAQHGLFGLYKGFWASSFLSLPAYGVYMGAYTASKDWLHKQASNAPVDSFQRRHAAWYAPLIAGFFADGISVALYVPGDVVIQRLQIASSPYHTVYDIVRRIHADEGLKGFFRGMGATFVTSGIASSIWWAAYENSKTALYSPPFMSILYGARADDGKLHRLPQIIAGFIAGTVASVVINPLDVVKVRLQTQEKPPAALCKEPQNQDRLQSQAQYQSFFHGLSQLWREEGVRGLFRGVVPKLISRGPLSAMSALLFEMILYYSRKKEPT